MSRLEIKQYYFDEGTTEYVAISVAIGIKELPMTRIKRIIDQVRHESTLCKMLTHKNIPFDVMPVAVDNFADTTIIHTEAEYQGEDIEIKIPDRGMVGCDEDTFKWPDNDEVEMDEGKIGGTKPCNPARELTWSQNISPESVWANAFELTHTQMSPFDFNPFNDADLEKAMSAVIGMKSPDKMKAKSSSFAPRDLTKSEVQQQNDHMAALIDSIK